MIHFDWMNKAANNSHQTITNQNNWPYPIKSHSVIVRHSTTVSFPCPIFYSFHKKTTNLADLMSQTKHCMMLHEVESFCTKFETGLTFSYSMCKQTQQMLGVFGQQCCVHLHGLYSCTFNTFLLKLATKLLMFGLKFYNLFTYSFKVKALS